jgi:YbbR domain-containing protein
MREILKLVAKLFTRNLPWKIFALTIAVLLWIAVANEPELSTFVSVPVEFKDLPETLEIASDLVDKVELEMSGPSGELRNFSNTGTAVVLDMSDAMPGERTYTIGDGEVKLPRGITLIRAIPSQLHFSFERRKVRSVPIAVRFSQAPAKFRVSPEKVTIEGPESRVSRIDAVPTDLVDVSGLHGTGTFHVNAYVQDPHVRITSETAVTIEAWK